MVGFTPRPEVKPPSEILIPDTPATTLAPDDLSDEVKAIHARYDATSRERMSDADRDLLDVSARALEATTESPITPPLPPHLETEDDFMRNQAVPQASEGVRRPDTQVVILSPGQLEALDAQAKSAASPMSDGDRAFWDKRSGKTQAEQVAQPTQSSASPDQKPRLRDALGTARSEVV